MKRILSVLVVCASPVWAGPEDIFVSDNLTGTFYHELAHAIVARKNLALYGQEEDAADVFAAYLIATWHDPEEGARIARSVALAFYGDHMDLEEGGDNISWDGYHGPSLQRMHNHLCVFAGADLTRYGPIAQELGMSPERLSYCDYEYDMARRSWGALVDQMALDQGEGALVIKGFSSHCTGDVGQWAEEIIPKVNSVITWFKPLDVRVEPCGESNAFYDGAWDIVRMCTEQTELYRTYYRLYGEGVVEDAVITKKKK